MPRRSHSRPSVYNVFPPMCGPPPAAPFFPSVQHLPASAWSSNTGTPIFTPNSSAFPTPYGSTNGGYVPLGSAGGTPLLGSMSSGTAGSMVLPNFESLGGLGPPITLDSPFGSTHGLPALPPPSFPGMGSHRPALLLPPPPIPGFAPPVAPGSPGLSLLPPPQLSGPIFLPPPALISPRPGNLPLPPIPGLPPTPVGSIAGSVLPSPFGSIRSDPPGYATANTSHANLMHNLPPYDARYMTPSPEYRRDRAADFYHQVDERRAERRAMRERERRILGLPDEDEEDKPSPGCRCVIL